MVKSCNSLLSVLPVCIGSYLKSAARENFLVFLPIIRTVCIYVSKDGGPWFFFRSQKGFACQKFGKHCLKTKDFFHTTVSTKFIFTGTVIFTDVQKCAARKLAVTVTCRNITWSTECFVLTADCNETQFEKKKKIHNNRFSSG